MSSRALDQIKEANRLEDILSAAGIALKKRGAELVGICPLHDDHNPSLRVNPKKQLWCCDPCGNGGDVFNWVMQREACDFPTAAEKLAQRAGIAIDLDETPQPVKRTIAATYDYTDETGKLLFQTVRYSPKDFRQRRPDGKGGWVWDLRGVKLVPYRLPEVLAATEVWIVEGEKDADTLAGLGLTATTAPLGACKWKPDYGPHFSGKDVVICGDNDKPGQKHAEQVAGSLYGIAASVKIVRLP